MTTDTTPTARPRKKVATTRSRAVAAAVSALAFFGIGAAMGARATNGASTGTATTVADATVPVTATLPIAPRSREDDESESGRVSTGSTSWQAAAGTTVAPAQSQPVPNTTSGGSTVPV